VSKSNHTEAQIIGALKQMEAGRSAAEIGRDYGVSKHTIYAWKAKYGGMDVSEAQEVKQLREENARLKKLVADLSLDKDMLQSVIRKTHWARREKSGSAAADNGFCGQRTARLRAHEDSAIELPVPKPARRQRATAAVGRVGATEAAFWLSSTAYSAATEGPAREP